MIDLERPDYEEKPSAPGRASFDYRSAGPTHAKMVSIITPYYNTEELFIETCVALQAQSLQNWEWVIVDDGSTDSESISRLASVAAADARIRVIRQSNAGPGAARNVSFANSTGDR